jgi:hypothetical protein
MFKLTVALGLALLYSAEASVTFVQQNNYVGSTSCANGNLAQSMIPGAAGQCLVLPTPACPDCPTPSQSQLMSFDSNTVLIYTQSTNCTGPSTSSSLQTVCGTLAVNGTDASLQTVKNTVNKNSAYNVTYYSDSKCTQGGYMFVNFPGVITSGIVGQCFNNIYEPAHKLMVAYDGYTYSFGFYDVTGTCQGSPVSTKAYKAFECVAAPADSNSLGYMIVSPWGTAPPAPPVQLAGQVDLNSDAYNLNKQVVGASVGVLCGLTALLVTVSMTGLLG